MASDNKTTSSKIKGTVPEKDDELNRAFEFDDEDSGLSFNPQDQDPRSPVASVLSGALDGFADTVTDNEFIMQRVKDALPDSYTESFKSLDTVARSMSQLYDDSVKDLKPQLSGLARKIDRLVPENSRFLKSITSKFNNWAGGDKQSFSSPSKEEMEEKTISDSLGNLFKAQAGMQTDLEARNAGERQIDRNIERKQFGASMNVSVDSYRMLSRIAGYTEGINQAFQKKSLELQFRQLFATRELLRLTKAAAEATFKQNEAIVKNSGLPDFAKIHNFEMVKEQSIRKLIGNAQDAMFGDDDPLKAALNRLGTNIKDSVQGFKTGFLDPFKDAAEMAADQFGEDGGMGETASEKFNSVGNMGGRSIGNAAGGFLQSFIKKHKSKMPGYELLEKFGDTMQGTLANPAVLKEKFFNNKEVKAFIEDRGLDDDSVVMKFINGTFDILSEKFKPQSALPTGVKGIDLLAAHDAGFSKRSDKTLNFVLPGYLSRMLREITFLRTKQDPGLTVFDYTRDKFDTTKNIASDIKKDVLGKFAATSTKRDVNDAFELIFKDENMSAEEKVKAKKFLLGISRENIGYSAEGIEGSETFAGLDAKEQARYKEILAKKLLDADDGQKTENELTKRLLSTRKSQPNVYKDIASEAMLGQEDALVEAGLVTKNSKGGYELNIKEILKLIDDAATKEDEGDSDIKIKKNIKSFNPRDAMRRLRNLKISTWNYRKDILGKDSSKTDIPGPMAQDVNANFGDKVAPNASKIDLMAMNGISLNAIKDLDQRLIGYEKKQEALRIEYDKKPDPLKIGYTPYDDKPQSSSELVPLENTYSGEKDKPLSKFEQIIADIKSDTGKMVEHLANIGMFGFLSFGQLADIDVEKHAEALKKFYNDKKASAMSSGEHMVLGVKKFGKSIKDKLKKPFNFITDKFNKVKDIPMKIGGWVKNKVMDNADLIKQKLKDGFDALLDAGKNIYEFGIKNIPKAITGIFKAGKSTAMFLKKRLDLKITDVYVKGEDKPRLKANLMRNGFYYDQATGKTILDWTDVKGTIVDGDKNVILSAEDIKDGLFDVNGKPLELPFTKLIKGAFRGLSGTLKTAKNLTIKTGKALIDVGRFLGEKAKGMSVGRFGLPSFDGIGVISKKTHNVLVQIRDMIAKKFGYQLPPDENDDKESTIAKAVKSIFKWKDKIKEKKPENGDKSEKKGFFSRMKDKLKKKFGRKTAETDTTSASPEVLKIGDAPLLLGYNGESTTPVEKSKFQKLKEKAARAKASAKSKVDELKKNIKEKVKQTKDSLKDKPTTQTPEQLKIGDAPLLLEYDKKTENTQSETKQDDEPKQSFFSKATDAFNKFRSKKRKGKGSTTSKEVISPIKIGPEQKALGYTPSEPGGKDDIEDISYVDKPDSGAKKSRFQRLKDSVKGAANKVSSKINGGITDKITPLTPDGKPERKGGAFERYRQMQEEIKNRIIKKSGVSTEARYQDTSKSFLNKALDMIGGVTDWFKGKLGGLFGTIGDLATGGFGKLLGGTAKLLGKGVMGAGKLLGKGAVGLFSTMSKGLGARGALGAAARLGATAALASGSPLLTLGAMAFSGISGIIASPVVLGAAAVGLAGYGAYKTYKYLTRNNVDKWQLVRIKQYGLTDSKRDESHYGKLMELEDLLCKNSIEFKNNQAYVKTNLEFKEVANIFGLDITDKDKFESLLKWFNGRFKPFFLTHLTALHGLNKKYRLNNIKEVSQEDKLKYLDAVAFSDGPYGVTDSPFSDIDELDTDQSDVFTAIENLKKEIRESKADKKFKEVPKTAVDKPEPNKAVAATPSPQATKPVNNASSSVRNAMKYGTAAEDGSKPTNAPVADPAPSVSSFKVAGGPIATGTGGLQYVQVGKDASIDGLNPALLKSLAGMAQDYFTATGNNIKINEGSRSYERQAFLYKKYPGKAAKPGTSLHEKGLAIDIDTVQMTELEKLGLLRKYGITRPVGGETWHGEPIGIQLNINKARTDPGYAEMAIEAGLLKGGGGVGANPNSPFGRRSIEAVKMALNASASTVALPGDSESSQSTATRPSAQSSMEMAKAVGETPNASTSDPKAVTVAANDKQGSQARQDIKQASAVKTPASTSVSEDGGKILNTNVVKTTKDSDAVKQMANVNPNSKEDILKVIDKAAGMTSVDPSTLKTFAALESDFKPNAKAKTSSAKGLFQFVNGTWDEMIKKHGNKYGFNQNTSQTDPMASSLLAGEYIKTNLNDLSKVKSDANVVDAYLAHFLGPTGAKKMLAASPEQIAAKIAPSAASSNYNMFAVNGRLITVGEFYDKIRTKVVQKAQQYGISLTGNLYSKSQASAPPRPESYVTPLADPNVKPTQAKTQQELQAVKSANITPPINPVKPVIKSNAPDVSPKAVNAFGNLESIGQKQLDVLNVVADLLRSIDGKVDPKHLAELLKGNAEVKPETPQGNQRRPNKLVTDNKRYEPMVDIRRT